MPEPTANQPTDELSKAIRLRESVANGHMGLSPDSYRFDAERQSRFLALLSHHWPNASLCAKAVGIHVTTYYYQLKHNAKFALAVQSIKAQALDQLEGVAMESGKDMRKGFLDRAMILRAHRPELYDRAKVVKIEGYKMNDGERSNRLNVVDTVIDAEISKSYLSRKEQREKRNQARLTKGESGKSGASGGGPE